MVLRLKAGTVELLCRDGRARLPLGVTGNTSDSGSEESWFEPRRGNLERSGER
jgi:hypothetical protein